MDQKTVTQSRLRELLNYDPVSGVFTWKMSLKTTIKVGDAAGGKKPVGYLYIGIDQRIYLAHRLAWFYMTGEWPKADIDHVNGIRDDNRFCNLREATRSENLQNKGASPSNHSGFKGVSFSKSKRRWDARIVANKKRYYLGSFGTPEEAHAAYCAAARKYHGEFSRF